MQNLPISLRKFEVPLSRQFAKPLSIQSELQLNDILGRFHKREDKKVFVPAAPTAPIIPPLQTPLLSHQLPAIRSQIPLQPHVDHFAQPVNNAFQLSKLISESVTGGGPSGKGTSYGSQEAKNALASFSNQQKDQHKKTQTPLPKQESLSSKQYSSNDLRATQLPFSDDRSRTQRPPSTYTNPQITQKLNSQPERTGYINPLQAALQPKPIPAEKTVQPVRTDAVPGINAYKNLLQMMQKQKQQ